MLVLCPNVTLFVLLDCASARALGVSVPPPASAAPAANVTNCLRSITIPPTWLLRSAYCLQHRRLQPEIVPGKHRRRAAGMDEHEHVAGPITPLADMRDH